MYCYQFPVNGFTNPTQTKRSFLFLNEPFIRGSIPSAKRPQTLEIPQLPGKTFTIHLEN